MFFAQLVCGWFCGLSFLGILFCAFFCGDCFPGSLVVWFLVFVGYFLVAWLLVFLTCQWAHSWRHIAHLERKYIFVSWLCGFFGFFSWCCFHMAVIIWFACCGFMDWLFSSSNSQDAGNCRQVETARRPRNQQKQRKTTSVCPLPSWICMSNKQRKRCKYLTSNNHLLDQ